LRERTCLLRRRRDASLGDRDPEAREELLARVLVEIHRRRTLAAWVASRSMEAIVVDDLRRRDGNVQSSGRQPGYAITQICSPIATGCSGATASSATVPDACAVTSFSIFIASTMQITWPTSTLSPSATFTSSTVPCIGERTAPDAPAAPPAAARSRRRRASSR